MTCCQISHNGKLAACGSDYAAALRIYDLDTGECLYDVKGIQRDMANITSLLSNIILCCITKDVIEMNANIINFCDVIELC